MDEFASRGTGFFPDEDLKDDGAQIDEVSVKSKRPVKLTYKALADKVEKLQCTRKDLFHKLKHL